MGHVAARAIERLEAAGLCDDAPHSSAPGRDGTAFSELSGETALESDSWQYRERVYPRVPSGAGPAVCLWDATALPLRVASVDVSIIDFPFGLNHKVEGYGRGRNVLYSRTLREVARVTREGGRLVILGLARNMMRKVLESASALWVQRRELEVNCGGAIARIFLLERTADTAVAS